MLDPRFTPPLLPPERPSHLPWPMVTKISWHFFRRPIQILIHRADFAGKARSGTLNPPSCVTWFCPGEPYSSVALCLGASPQLCPAWRLALGCVICGSALLAQGFAELATLSCARRSRHHRSPGFLASLVPPPSRAAPPLSGSRGPFPGAHSLHSAFPPLSALPRCATCAFVTGAPPVFHSSRRFVPLFPPPAPWPMGVAFSPPGLSHSAAKDVDSAWSPCGTRSGWSPFRPVLRIGIGTPPFSPGPRGP